MTTQHLRFLLVRASILASLNSVIGCINPELLASEHFAPSLLRRGFLTFQATEDKESGREVRVYTITEAGRGALAKADPAVETSETEPVTKGGAVGFGNPTIGINPEGGRPGQWNETKIAVLNALKTLRADSLSSAKPTNEVAATAGVNPEMVRHSGYLLAAEGLVEVSQADNVKG